MSTVQGIHQFDMNDEMLLKAGVNTIKPLEVSTVLMNELAPRYRVFRHGGDELDTVGIAHLLVDDNLRSSVIEILGTRSKTEKLLADVTVTQNGQFSTNSDSISFDICEDRILNSSLSVNPTIALILANLLTPFRLTYGLAARSFTVKTIEQDDKVYPGKQEIIAELKENIIKKMLDDIDWSFMQDKGKKKESISYIAAGYESQFLILERNLARLKKFERDFENVLVLIKSFVAKDYTHYTPEEIEFFSENSFLALATNITLIREAMDIKFSRPTSGYVFWMDAVNNLNSVISSSECYRMVEIAKIKELYTLSHVETSGIRKGIILSRNMSESTNLGIYHSRAVGNGGLVKLTKDKGAENFLNPIFTKLKAIDSAKIHEFASSSLSNVVTRDTRSFIHELNVSSEELEYIAASLSDKVYLDTTGYVDNKGAFKLAYLIDTKSAKVDEKFGSFLGSAVVTNSIIPLFYAEPYVGRIALTLENNPIDDDKRTMMVGVKNVFGLKLDTELRKKLVIGSASLPVKWKISDLTGLVALDNTYSTLPLVGKILFSELLQTHKSLRAFAAGMNHQSVSNFLSSVEVDIDMRFVSVVKGILDSEEVELMMQTAKSRIWSENQSQFKGKRLADSVLAEEHVLTRLKLEVAFFIIGRLGFIPDSKVVKEMMDLMTSTHAFTSLVVRSGK